MTGHGSQNQEGASLDRNIIDVADAFAKKADRLASDEGGMMVPLSEVRVVPLADADPKTAKRSHSPIVPVGEQQIWHE